LAKGYKLGGSLSGKGILIFNFHFLIPDRGIPNLGYNSPPIKFRENPKENWRLKALNFFPIGEKWGGGGKNIFPPGGGP